MDGAGGNHLRDGTAVLDRRRQRLLAEDVSTCRDRGHHLLAMRRRRAADAHGVDLVEKLAVVRHGLRAAASGKSLSAIGGHIGNRGDLHPVDGEQVVGVGAAMPPAPIIPMRMIRVLRLRR